MKNLILLTFSFLMLTSSSLFAQQDGKAKEMFTKKELPSLSLMNIDGQKVDVADFGKNGKITVISFWATWCSPCKKELNNMSYLYEEWQDEYDLEIVAVSIDDARSTAKVKSYVNGQGWDYDVLLDTNSDLKRLLNFQTVPFTILVDANGNIAYTHTGYVEGDEYILEDHIIEIVE